MLRVVFQLIDIRHDPTEKDKEMYDTLLQCGFSPIIIATKADKIKRSQLNKQVKAIEDKLQLVEGTPVIPFSSSDLTGKDELWEYIDEYVESFSE